MTTVPPVPPPTLIHDGFSDLPWTSLRLYHEISAARPENQAADRAIYTTDVHAVYGIAGRCRLGLATGSVGDVTVEMVTRGWADLGWSALGLLAARDAGLGGLASADGRDE
ncbi:MAG: hypothetical protein QOF90_269 [Acetobacteraceae bacterium]|nr:hypothetical protein [Acetobacteraceae bacterium]